MSIEHGSPVPDEDPGAEVASIEDAQAEPGREQLQSPQSSVRLIEAIVQEIGWTIIGKPDRWDANDPDSDRFVHFDAHDGRIVTFRVSSSAAVLTANLQQPHAKREAKQVLDALGQRGISLRLFDIPRGDDGVHRDVTDDITNLAT